MCPEYFRLSFVCYTFLQKTLITGFYFMCRYFKVLIQEMDLRLDLGFLYALVEFFTRTDVLNDQEVETFCCLKIFKVCNSETCILKN